MKLLQNFTRKTPETPAPPVASLAERQALVAERARAAEARDIDCEPLARAVQESDARVAQLEQQLKASRDTALQARQAFAARANQGDAAVAQCNAKLERGADPKINEFFRVLGREIENVRTQSAPSRQVALHLDGLRQAQGEALALKTAAIEDVPAALTEIRARIPSKWDVAA